MKKSLSINGIEAEVKVAAWGDDHLEFEFEGETYRFRKENDKLLFRGKPRKAFAVKLLPLEAKQVFVDSLEAEVSILAKAKKASGHQGGAGSLQSPMPGKIFKVLKGEGEEVKLGDPVIILEAMKMEHTIKAQQDGIVKKINYPEGAQVQGGVELCEIE